MSSEAEKSAPSTDTCKHTNLVNKSEGLVCKDCGTVVWRKGDGLLKNIEMEEA